MSPDINEILNAEQSIETAYQDAVEVLKKQPADERGAIIILAIVGEDMKGKAYGKAEDWAKMMLGVAQRNEEFSLALRFAAHELMTGAQLLGNSDNE